MILWANDRKYENLLQFNTSWLASLRTGYCIRLCFNFSCSCFDLTLIKNSHTLNCYLFLQKFLLKTKTYKLAFLVFGKYGSSVYCWKDKFRKGYLFFVTYVLLNTCDLLLKTDFTWKKKFPPENGWGWGAVSCTLPMALHNNLLVS